MRCFCLALLFLAASVRAESARETETWVPSGQPTEESLEDLASGDSPNSSDFAFQAEDDLESYDDDENDDDDDFSGSGDEDFPELHGSSPSKPDIIDNRIPDQSKPDQPKDNVNENDIVAQNEVGHGRMRPEDVNTNVLMSHSAEESIFNKTEVLAALIAGGAVGLLFAILLILLLIYRMKKKDEGSYDLGKKPIYKKAPTAEIYA
ncbi:syndecan-4 isoform X2 [Lepisosteus oculatus]|uniref:syndecan-4 isoform X2 n=1 Tax=Lepisosteus oculatus TaxID=7918 RepID=UPI00073FEBAF|nr:PREDICTED: syndecan-4 isoform X2 [Lepisosteus oculatus]